HVTKRGVGPYSAILHIFPTGATRHEVGSMDVAPWASGPSGGRPSVCRAGPPPAPRPLPRELRRLEPPPSAATRGQPRRDEGLSPADPSDAPGPGIRPGRPTDSRL